jgi:hypothetical protein
VAVALIDLSIRCPFFRGTMQELLQTLANLSPSSSTTRSSEWPKSPRLLSVKLRQLAPQLQSIGIDVEFVREHEGRFVTVAMNEDGHLLERDRGRALVGQRVQAYLEH